MFHNAIPEYLSNDLEHVQFKRALSIISPGNSYNKNLELFNISSLCDRRTELCRKFFNNIIANPSNKLHHLLPPRNIHKYNLRHKQYLAENISLQRSNFWAHRHCGIFAIEARIFQI